MDFSICFPQKKHTHTLKMRKIGGCNQRGVQRFFTYDICIRISQKRKTMGMGKCNGSVHGGKANINLRYALGFHKIIPIDSIFTYPSSSKPYYQTNADRDLSPKAISASNQFYMSLNINVVQFLYFNKRTLTRCPFILVPTFFFRSERALGTGSRIFLIPQNLWYSSKSGS